MGFSFHYKFEGVTLCHKSRFVFWKISSVLHWCHIIDFLLLKHSADLQWQNDLQSDFVSADMAFPCKKRKYLYFQQRNTMWKVIAPLITKYDYTYIKYIHIISIYIYILIKLVKVPFWQESFYAFIKRTNLKRYKGVSKVLRILQQFTMFPGCGTQKELR